MATITSAQSGLASATTTWVGGVVPVVGDKAIIAAGHTVTLDGTYHWGDDTLTGITVNGTLRASRTVSSQLTCRGDLYVDVIAGGRLDYGTEADPIPSAITAAIITNSSAAMAHNKWGVRTNETSGAWTGGVYLWGANKTPFTFLSAAVASGDTDIPVLDATGWQVGDVLGFQPPSGNVVVYRAVTAITPGAGTSAMVSIGASTGRAGAAGNGVLNTTRNVRVSGNVGQTWRSHMALRGAPTSVAADAGVYLGPCEIRLGGGASNTWQMAGLNLHHQQNNNLQQFVRRVAGPVVSAIWSVAGSVVTNLAGNQIGVNFFQGQAASYPVDSMFVAMPTGTGTAVFFYGGCSVDIGPASVVLGALNSLSNGYSQGPVGCNYSGYLWGGNTAMNGTGVTLTLRGAKLDAAVALIGYSAGGDCLLQDCAISAAYTGVTPGHSVLVPSGTLWPTRIVNSIIGPSFGVSRASSGLQSAHPEHYLSITQRNGDPASNERYTRGGRTHRDATRARRSTASICLASWYSANVLSMPLTAKVPAGDTLRVKGSVWIEAAYLPGDAPGIGLSATGLTTVNWSAPAVADAWQEFDLSITNTNAYPTDVSITLTARSNANTETARVWVDGVFADPWSGSVRHYGFQWLAQTALVADSRITLTEAAALALPVAVDHTAQTITVTGALTARQVFEACMADLAQTVNQGRSVHLTSATGDSFETSYTVTTSGAGVIAGAYVDSTGRHVTVSAPALIAGSRVQVYDLTTSTELFNGVLAAQGMLLPLTWSADHTLRLRAEHADMLALETVAVLSSAGATVLDVQQADTVYMGNGIDGSTCTEFTADGANVQVDISDPDGVTSVQRLYAWAQWYQTTAAGIASAFFGAVEALDSASYLIDQAKADIKLDNGGAMPVRVVGGYLSRRDGSTVIAAASGSIQMDPGKAYVAGVDGLARESTVQAVLAVSLG